MSRDFSIRRADSEDVTALCDMYVSMYDEYAVKGIDLPFSLNTETLPNHLGTQVRSKFCGVFLAETPDGRVFGMINCTLLRLERKFRQEGFTGYISELFIVPWMRRSGAAAALYETAEKWLCEYDATLIKIEVLSGNEDGFAFWQKQGFSEGMRTFFKEPEN